MIVFDVDNLPDGVTIHVKDDYPSQPPSSVTVEGPRESKENTNLLILNLENQRVASCVGQV